MSNIGQILVVIFVLWWNFFSKDDDPLKIKINKSFTKIMEEIIHTPEEVVDAINNETKPFDINTDTDGNITIQSTTEKELIITDLVANKGHCQSTKEMIKDVSRQDETLAGVLLFAEQIDKLGGKGERDFPIPIEYGETVKIKLFCKGTIIETTVVTNMGSFTDNWKYNKNGK